MNTIKNKLLNLNPLLIFYYFALTTLAIRGAILWAWTRGDYPAIYLRGVHLHHFTFGFLFLAWSIWAAYKTSTPRWVLELTFGIGFGLVFDEFIFWSLYRFDYWSMGNFFALVLAAALVGILSINDPKPIKIKIRKQLPPRISNPLNPKVSVVIPAYNEENYIEPLFRSLSRQTYTDFEVVVVDNNSTDQTAEKVRFFGGRVVYEATPGVGFARQRGFLEAKGEIIVTTDADAEVPNNWIEKLVSEFDHDPALACVGGLYRLSSGPVSARLFFPRVATLFWKFDHWWTKRWSIPGVNMAVRKTAFLKSGGFNVALKIGEDADLSRRLEEFGLVKFLPRLLVRTSGRRYRHGLIAGLTAYLPNAFARTFLSKNKNSEFPSVRTDYSAIRHVIMPWLSFSVILLVLFSTQNPGIAHAKGLAVLNVHRTYSEEHVELSSYWSNQKVKLPHYYNKLHGKFKKIHTPDV